MKKIMWVKFGWSNLYQGGPVRGDFAYMANGAVGHEAWNFAPGRDREYYCYVPPLGRSAAKPWNADAQGWTVVCLAKKPGQKGVHVVGWYEDATLAGEYRPRPGFEDSGAVTQDGWGPGLSYSISAPHAYLVPPNARTNPFSHPSVKQGKYSYLAGPGVSQTEHKRQVCQLIEKELYRLRGIAIGDPGQTHASKVRNS